MWLWWTQEITQWHHVVKTWMCGQSTKNYALKSNKMDKQWGLTPTQRFIESKNTANFSKFRVLGTGLSKEQGLALEQKHSLMNKRLQGTAYLMSQEADTPIYRGASCQCCHSNHPKNHEDINETEAICIDTMRETMIDLLFFISLCHFDLYGFLLQLEHWYRCDVVGRFCFIHYQHQEFVMTQEK